MKVTVQAVNFDIAEKLEQYIEKKTKKYHKFLGDSAEMEIRMTVVKPESAMNKETTVRISGVGQELFAQKTFDTFEQGVDECLEAIGRQIEKMKEKK